MMRALTDQTRMCLDCERPFVVTRPEREFYERLGYPTPRHCKRCRVERKELRQAQARDERIAAREALAEPLSRDQ